MTIREVSHFSLTIDQLETHLKEKTAQLEPKLNEVVQKQTRLLDQISLFESRLSTRIEKKRVSEKEINQFRIQLSKIQKYRTRINANELNEWKGPLLNEVKNKNVPLTEIEKLEVRLLQVEHGVYDIEHRKVPHLGTQLKEAKLIYQIKRVENWLVKLDQKKSSLQTIEEKVTKKSDKWLYETQNELKKYFYGSSISSLIVGLGTIAYTCFMKCPCSNSAKNLMAVGLVGTLSSVVSLAISFFWCIRLSPAEHRAAYRYTFICSNAMAGCALLLNIATIAFANPMCEYLNC